MKNTRLILLPIYLNLLFATQVNVGGSAFLSNTADHAGINVKFLAVSPSAVTDSTITGSDGSYALTVEVGIYNIVFSKTGYISQSLPNYFISQDTTLSDVTLLYGTLVDISGALSGTLSADYVYRVVGDLTVPDTSSLTIEPGVQLRFDGDYNLYCYGPITVVGTELDSIYFTSAQPSPTPGDWGGVYVYYNDYDSTNLANQFAYCVFTYGRGNSAQLEINSSLVSITQTSFRSGDRGDLYFNYSYGIVTNSNFSGGSNNSWNINNYNSEVYYRNLLLTNFDDAFYVRGNNADVELKTSSFLDGNRRALYTDGWATVLVDSCLFQNIKNDWTVQFHDNSLVQFSNNILDDVQSWGALGVWSDAHVNIINNYIEGKLYYSSYNNNSQNQVDPPQIYKNMIVRHPQDCCYEGLQILYNNRLIEAHHNTIYGFSNGHRGIYLYDNDSLSIHSNIIFGNSNGIYSYNNDYMDYSYNCFFANDNLTQENDFPAGFGQVVTTNANGDPADIYANIFLDPEFEDVGSRNFDLKVTSPAINAGSPAYMDADSTISDMGAKPYFFPFLIDHTPLTTTNDTIGPYVVNAEITPTQGQTITNTLYYKFTPNGFWTLQGSENTSLYFNGNGSHDHVVIPYDPATGTFDALTIEAWVKPVTANYGYTIYSNRSTNGSESILLYYNAWDRRIRWHINTGYGFQSFDGNTRLEPGQWYHVAIVYDGTQSTLYVNGNYDGSMSVSGTIYNTSGDPYIGYRRDYGSDWNGYIDEFRIWDVARAQGEIQDYMGRELFGTESGLVGYWKFNETSGNTVHDLTGNHNDGMVVGAYFVEEDPNLLPAEGFNLSEWTSVTMNNTSGNVYSGEIPSQSLNTTVDYFIQVTDGIDTLNSPYYVPYEFHRFHVSLFESLVTFTSIQQNDGTIALNWGTPVPITGSLTGYNIYFDTQSDVSLDSDHLLTALTSNQNSYVHTGLTEGETYYYKLTALLDDGSETLIAPEINAMSDNSTLLLAQGMVQVENASEHSGVKIVFTPETTAGSLDSVYSDSTGYFSIILPVSIYTVDITKDGCVPVHIPSLYLSDNYDFGVIQLLARPIQELSGIVTDTLTSDYYYVVTGNLTVQNNDTLFIEPGTVIAFDGYYRIEVYGKLFAEGAEGDSIYFTSNAYQPSPGDWEYIRLMNNAGESHFEYCVFEYGDGWSEWVGSGILRIEAPNVFINRCRFSHNQRGAIAIRNNNARGCIVQNSVFSFNNYDQNQDAGIINVCIGSNYGDIVITGNSFYQNFGYDINAYDTDDLIITNNIFYSDNNYDNSAIRARWITPLIFTDNILTGRSYFRVDHDCYGIVKNNTITHNISYTHAIYINQSSMTIEGNTITNCNQGIYYQNNRSFSENVLYPHVIRNNVVNGTYYSGIYVRDNSRDIDIYNNSIVNADLDNNNGSDASALYFYNNAGDIFLHSNVVVDSRYAMYLDNTGNIDVYNNDFWNNDNLFQGSGYPQGLGTVTSQNNNGDPADIYSNIYLDPEFVDPDSNDFNLQPTSPLIDAGYILFSDPDGTILDIGALYFDHGNPHNLAVSDEDENSVTLQWSTVTRDSLTGYNLYSKLHTETDYALVQFTPDTFGTVTGLTNNLDYDFVVTSVYPNSESIYSVKVTGRPGLAEIAIAPEYLIQSVAASDSTSFAFSISNNGSKDLEYWLNEDSLLNRFIGYYYNNSNWDDFSNLLAVREDSVINFNWDDNSQLPPGVPNNNFHVRWEGQIRLAQSGDYYFEYCVDDGFRMSFNDNWVIWTGGCCWCSHNQYFDAGVYDVVIDYYAYGNPNYLYLKWQPPGGSLDWFRLPNPITPSMFWEVNGTISPDSTTQNQLTIPPRNSGVYTTFLPFSSNDKSDPYLTLPVLQMVDYTFIPPVQFTPGSQTGDPFYLVVDNADVDGDPLQPGDELALFDGDSCVGAGMFDGNLPFVVRANGFTSGNSYSVKAWDNSQYRYATAQIETYTVGNGSYLANGFNEVTLSATVYVTNQITLIPNQFNLVSLNHYPQNPDASLVFGDIEGLEIVYDDEGGAFIPAYNINTIGSVDITEGYYLFFDSVGTDLTYTGLPISVSDWPLLLQAQRWNYFSYLKDQPADVSVLFASITDSIDIIQSDDGGAWIPSMGINTLGNLTPGKGYTTFLTANTDQTFIYPATQGTLSRLLAGGPTPQHFIFERTGLPYTMIIQKALFEGRPLEEGDEIGIFDGERCVGAGVFYSAEPLVITAWQGDEKLEIAGFVEGNPITFRVFSQKYRKEYPQKATFRREAESYFKNTPYTVVKRVNTSGGIIPDVYALGHNYPNPFNPITRIPYQLPEDTRVRITVYNLLGQEVVILVNDFQLAAYHTAVWNGRDTYGREVPSGVYIYRMETPTFHKTQKLVLLK